MCMCLTKNRPEMLAHAVRCFNAQTYENKWLLIFDTGFADFLYEGEDVYHIHALELGHLSIGALRNAAISYTDPSFRDLRADIICHFDDDDYSHRNRIAEQVALLQASGADVAGYSDMLFWREADQQAWLYLGPQKALGTSLAYWRPTWERKPFPDQPRPGFATGEDTDWIRGLNLASVPSFSERHPHYITKDPRMIARIHRANTSGSYQLMEHSDSWRRVPDWDNYCREVFA
jgi:glycosyltransferase involved in cell wall biosynthesis